MACWSVVPTDVLWNIIKRLPLVDYIHFGDVCLSWRAALAEKRCRPAPQLPWLIIPDDHDAPLSLFSIWDTKMYNVPLRPPDMAGRYCRCVGSSGGWLVLVDKVSELHMFDPISRDHVRLPSITTLSNVVGVSCGEWTEGGRGQIKGYYVKSLFKPNKITLETVEDMRGVYIRKAVVSMCPSFVVAVIHTHSYSDSYSNKLAFAREGDESWTTINITDCRDSNFRDVIFCKEQLYALDQRGWVIACCDLSRRTDTGMTTTFMLQTLLPPLPYYIVDRTTKYLAELCGDVLLVTRETIVTSCELSMTVVVKAYKLEGSKQMRWVEVKSLQEHALFLGESHSIALFSQDFPELQANSIYFWVGGRAWDVRVYDLTDNKSHFEQYPLPNYQIPDCLPIWFFPPS